jgi:predicted nucleic acid-binding protein
MEYYAIKVHYFDASALVKLVAEDPDDEPGRNALRRYHNEHAHPGYTTSFCIAEAFGALKSKFLRHRISQAQYLKSVKDLIRVTGNTFQIDELPILDPIVNSEFQRLSARYSLDFVDCLQIVTILKGQFRIFEGPSKSVLITADRELAKAARNEGARVWECSSEDPPPKN